MDDDARRRRRRGEVLGEGKEVRKQFQHGFIFREEKRERDDDEREREGGKGEQYLHSLSRCVLNHE